MIAADEGFEILDRATCLELLATAQVGQRITYCFLDDDPVATAERLRPVLERRWSDTGVTPLLAAPFHPVVPRDWQRHLP